MSLNVAAGFLIYIPHWLDSMILYTMYAIMDAVFTFHTG